MINLITRNVLNCIDNFYHRKRIFNFFKNYNPNLNLIIDIGANIGEYTKLFKKVYVNSKIICFEPQSKIFMKMKKNLASYNNISFYNCAVGNENTAKELNINLGSSYISSFSDFNENSIYFKIRKKLLKNNNNNIYENVKVIRLDSVEEIKSKKIDLIKIDVEGHELEVLEGLGSVINDTEMIMLEIHNSKMYKNYDAKKIENFLFNKGFQILKCFKFPFLNWSDKIFIKY